MVANFDPQDVIERIYGHVFNSFLYIQEHNENCNNLSKEGNEVDELSHILDAIKEKSYEQAFVLYLKWIDGSNLTKSRISMLKQYARYLDVKAPTLDTMISFEEAVENGLIKIPLSNVPIEK